jgi:hypothetical protein
MTGPATACLNAVGDPKKAYPSEHAAKRDLAHSHRWRRRAEWPIPYLCPCCRAYHLTRGDRM